MKNLLTLLCGLAICPAVNAQHVFTEATGPKNHVGIDTVYGVNLGTLPGSIPDAQWHLWDFSSVALSGYKYYSVFAAESGFSGATHSNLAYIDYAPGIKYESKLMFAVETTGIRTYGERLARQAFSLAAQSGNTADSLIVLAQDVMYSAPQVQLPYPATIGTKWNSTSKSTTNLQLTLTMPSPLPSYNKDPAERRSTTTSTCEVVGWGTARVKRLDGKSSGSKPVLQVKATISTVDSLYINGTPAPNVLLQAAGLSQGQTRIVYQKSYYREYEMLPMVNITYKDATFSQTDDFNVHAQRLPYPDGVSNMPAAIIAEVYPNPSNGSFTINVSDCKDATWTYAVTDITGNQIASGTLTGSKTQVSLAHAAAGSYVVSVFQNGEAVSGQKITVQ